MYASMKLSKVPKFYFIKKCVRKVCASPTPKCVRAQCPLKEVNSGCPHTLPSDDANCRKLS